MNIIHSFFLFWKEKRKKSDDKEIYKPANMPVKTLNVCLKIKFSRKKKKRILADINPKTYKYDTELIRKNT